MKSNLERKAESYAKSVIEEYDLDVSDATYDFSVTGRLTRTHGNIRGSVNNHDYTIKLSSHAIDNFGWDHIKGVIRHELAHLVTYLEHGMHSESDPRFKEKLRMLDAPESTDEPATKPKYIVVCRECGHKYKRHKKSKVIKKPQRYSCGDCDGPLRRIK